MLLLVYEGEIQHPHHALGQFIATVKQDKLCYFLSNISHTLPAFNLYKEDFFHLIISLEAYTPHSWVQPSQTTKYAKIDH